MIPFMFLIPIVGYMIPNTKILDMIDLQWEYLNEKNIINKLIKKMLTFIMIQGIKKFNSITVTTHYEQTLLAEKYSIYNVHTIFTELIKNTMKFYLH